MKEELIQLAKTTGQSINRLVCDRIQGDVIAQIQAHEPEQVDGWTVYHIDGHSVAVQED